jgi:general secretion pathway protein G
MTAPLPAALRRRVRREGGFTLLELIIVIAIIGILAAIVVPTLIDKPRRAKEAVLRTNLLTLRDTIGQYYGDKGRFPSSLQALVDDRYLPKIPLDPITGSRDTWIPIYQEEGFEGAAETDLSPDGEPGIMDVRSGAPGNTLDGTPYSEL